MSDLVTRLRTAAEAVFGDTPVVFAYLFGSQARGTHGPRSDVDIAAYFDPCGEDAFDLSVRLATKIEEAADVSGVDPLLILNRAPIALAGRVVEGGALIYSRDDVARVRHFSSTLRHYHDFKFHEEHSARERLARIAGEP